MRGESGSGHRLPRLEQLLLEEMKALFEAELSDPALSGVGPIAVTLSPDYRHARVHCVVLGSSASRGEIERALARANGFVRRRVGEAIELKRLPEIGFVVVAERAE